MVTNGRGMEEWNMEGSQGPLANEHDPRVASYATADGAGLRS